MTQLPNKQELRDWIAENPGQTSKRDIARAFGIRGADRIELRELLRELQEEGTLERRKRRFRDTERLPPVAVLTIFGPDDAGDLFARAMGWKGQGPEPRILVHAGDGDPALGAGDRVLAKLRAVQGEDHQYEAKPIRRIASGPTRILGIFRKDAEGGRITPIEKGGDREWRVAAGATEGAQEGELVEAEPEGPATRLGTRRARVIARLGDPSQPRAVSLIAIHQHGIPDEFPQSVLDAAASAQPAALSAREDLRALPFITIDPEDARDHDDAVLARPDDDPNNPGGHVVWVAIADVAYYVRPGSSLDREARKRGNSTYFPDRVVPMLPDALSGDLCSLHEGADRAVLAVSMVLDAQGRKIAHRFTRAMIRSAASLSYRQVQDAQDGRPNETCAPLLETVIHPLWAAWRAMHAERSRREPLEIDLPERRVVLSEDGHVLSVDFRERLEAHRLIEDCMVLANVAAAEELIRRRRPLLFRVHEEPAPEKLDALREVAQASGMVLAKGQVLKTSHLNRLLAQAEGTEFDELINMATLRSMTQAYYNPENFGHFGLALRNYAHFTSPIRRYADLIVHRSLITAHGWGNDGLSPDEIDRLDETAKHISDTERRSMTAERDTIDRYLAAWLAERVGAEFGGRVSGVTRFGLFVKLDESGADGLVPVRTLGHEFFHFDGQEQSLTGERSRLRIVVGARVLVRLAEATPITGGLTLELLELEGKALPRAPVQGRGKSVARKAANSKNRARKLARKAVRRKNG